MFHETLITPYHSPAFSSQVEPAPPPPDLIDNNEEYEVESILKARRWGRGIRFLVHWKGYPHEDDTWEPRTNLGHAQDALKLFYDTHPDAPGNTAPSKGPRTNLEKGGANVRNACIGGTYMNSLTLTNLYLAVLRSIQGRTDTSCERRPWTSILSDHCRRRGLRRTIMEAYQ